MKAEDRIKRKRRGLHVARKCHAQLSWEGCQERQLVRLSFSSSFSHGGLRGKYVSNTIRNLR